jgi:hypothetical protein
LVDRELSKLRTAEARAFLARRHDEVFPAVQLLSTVHQLLTSANVLLRRNDSQQTKIASEMLSGARAAVDLLPAEIVHNWRQVLTRESRYSARNEILELSSRSRCNPLVLREYQSFCSAVYTDNA